MLAQFSFKELEKRNMAITKLFIDHISTGVYGRTLLHLKRREQKKEGDGNEEKDDRDSVSKLRKFSPGDIVGVFQSQGQANAGQANSDNADGIVYKVTNDEIVISFNEMHDFENFKQPLNIALLANNVTYQRSK